MFHKVIGIILKTSRSSRSNGLQAYMNNIQRGGRTSGPTYDEARRDYQSIIHQEQA